MLPNEFQERVKIKKASGPPSHPKLPGCCGVEDIDWIEICTYNNTYTYIYIYIHILYIYIYMHVEKFEDIDCSIVLSVLVSYQMYSLSFSA